MIAITGGGTGGHLKIARVIKDELNKRGIKPIFIGSTKGADRKWFLEDRGFSEKYFLNSSGIVDKKGLKKITSLKNIISLSFKAQKILKRHNIKAVFSVGGFSAAPASLGALFSNIPLFIHEQNAYTGTLNRLLKPFSKRFFNTFLYNDPYPVEEIFFESARVRKEIKTVIFLGGSQGALGINNFALKIAPILNKKGIKIIHQTGKRDFKRVKEFYKKEKIQANVFDFDKNLAKKIASADFAISRAGASTLFELASNQIPTLFIPYPYAAKDHQYKNASYIIKKAGGLLRRENELSLDIIEEIFSINLKDVSQKLATINKKDGAKIIVDEVMDVLSV